MVGSGYELRPGEGGVGAEPPDLLELTDWKVADTDGCIADVLAFRFHTADEASGFARQQAESVGLAPQDVNGTTVWFSAGGDAARVAIGPVALALTIDPPGTEKALALVQAILEATPAAR